MFNESLKWDDRRLFGQLSHIAKRLNKARWATEDGLQGALDQIANGAKHIVIPPGTYDITVPLTITNASEVHIDMRGATIRATQNLSYLFDINGMAYSQIEGGLLTTANGAHVDTMMRYGWDGVVSRSSTRCAFRDIHFTGNYITGLQVGYVDNGVQTDNSHFEGLTFQGGSNNDATLWQYGVKLVEGVFANTMLHSLVGCSLGPHKTGVLVDKVRCVRLEDISLSGCGVDFDSRATNYIEIKGGRSEDSGQFLKAAPSGASYPQSVSLQGCTFDSPTALNNNHNILEFTQGNLNIQNLQVYAVPVNVIPKLKIGYGNRKAFVNVQGYQVATDTSISAASALFDCDTKANVNAFGMIHMNASGSQVDNECYTDYNVRDGVAV